MSDPEGNPIGRAAEAVLGGRKIEVANAEDVKFAQAARLEHAARTGTAKAELDALRQENKGKGLVDVHAMGRVADSLSTDPIIGLDGRNIRDDHPKEIGAERQKAVEFEMAAQEQLIQKGFDSLTEVQKGVVLDKVAASLKANSNLNLGSVDDTTIHRMAENVCRTDTFVDSLNKHHGDYKDLTSRIDKIPIDPAADPKLYSDVLKARPSAEKAQDSYRDESRKLDAASARLDIAKMGQGVELRAKQDRIVADAANIKSEISSLETQKKNPKITPEEKAKIDTQLEDANYRLKANAEEGQYADDIQEGRKNPAAEIPIQESAIAHNEKAKESAKAKLDTEQAKLTKAENAFKARLEDRLKAEGTLVQAIDGALGKSATEYVAKVTTIFEQKIAPTVPDKGSAREQLSAITTNEWYFRGKGKLLGIERDVKHFNKDKIKADYGKLVSGDIHGLMKQYVDRLNISDAEKDALMKDSSAQNEVVTKLLHFKMKHAGGISEDDTDILANTTWGQKALEHALDKNVAGNKLGERMKNEMVQSGGFKEWLSKQSDKKLKWVVISAILAGAAAAVIPLIAPGIGLWAIGTGVAGTAISGKAGASVAERL